MLAHNPAVFAQADRPKLTRAGPLRVLVDLSHAADGYVGVAQDLRLIFAMLCGLEQVDVAGLLMPTCRHDLPRVRAGAPDEAALTAAVLHCMERNWQKPPRRPFPLSILQSLQLARQIARGTHEMVPVADPGQLDALWRVLFAKTLAPEFRALVRQQSYFATDLSVSGIIDRVGHFSFGLPKRLVANGFHAVIFCMPRPVILPHGTRQIVRFHDSVPITDTDTIMGWKIGMAHSRLVRRCARDAIFVCNSPQSRDELAQLDPSRAERAVVIPCAVAPKIAVNEGIDPALVTARYAIFRALGADAPPPGWVPPETGFRYVLSVSTLEPRKNFPGLIRAFERVAARSDPALRLVIVGSSGWREEMALREMRAGVGSGRIVHLQNVPMEELQALMRGAACFAFPSFNEGFGYSPLEAMQAGAPCVVSDIPVFRWIFGEAAIYADPYDAESIARGIERLTGPGVAPLVQSLRGRAEPVLARFRPATVRDSWDALLDSLRPARHSLAT